MGTPGDSLGRLAGCPPTRILAQWEEKAPGESSLGKRVLAQERSESSPHSGGRGGGGGRSGARQSRRPRAEVEVIQVANESWGVSLRSLFHLGTPGSFPNPCWMATLSSACSVPLTEPVVPR